MPSRRVLEKNGFQEEGYAENYLQIDGKWADHVLFGLTRERWESRRRPGKTSMLV
jgi:ribosomal-protein-alanine N-acetyltransferase